MSNNQNLNITEELRREILDMQYNSINPSSTEILLQMCNRIDRW